MKSAYWKYLTDILTKSEATNVNFLFQDKNIFISDNHLSALWGWMQRCNVNDYYNFVHIDSHEDLCIPCVISWLSQLKNIKEFETFLNFRQIPTNMTRPMLTWDTYIQIAYYLFPNWFKKSTFVSKGCCHFGEFDDCRINHQQTNCNGHVVGIEKKSPFIYKNSCDLEMLLNDIANNTDSVILNLDIDYFFNCDYHERDPYWTNEMILRVVDSLKRALDSCHVQVLTIAMSPECCGGWKASLEMTKNFLPILSDDAQQEFLSVLEKKINNIRKEAIL